MTRIDHVISSVRPIKKLFLLDPTDFQRFAKIIRLVSEEIAGITNLVLPISDANFDEVLIRFIWRHDPDLAINYTTIPNQIIERRLRIPTFAAEEAEESAFASTHLLIWDNLGELFREEINKRPEEVYTVISNNESFDFFLGLHFGAVSSELPSLLEGSIFKRFRLQDITPESVIQNIHNRDQILPYLSLGLSMGEGGGSSIYEPDDNPSGLFDGKPTLVLGSLESLESMAYFWNMRATYPYCDLAWLPIEQLDNCPLDLDHYTHLAIKIPDGTVKGRAAKLSQGRVLIDASRYYFNLYYDGWSSLEHVSTVSVANHQFTLMHPAHKMFSRSGANMNVTLEVRGPVELIAPMISRAGGLYDPYGDAINPLNFSRISRRGLATRVRQFEIFREADYHLTASLPPNFEVFDTLFRLHGYSLSRTKGTSVTEQMLNVAGGFDTLPIFATDMALRIFTVLTPKRTQKIIEQIKESVSLNSAGEQILRESLLALPSLTQPQAMSLAQLEGKLQIRKQERGEFTSLVQRLYDSGILLRGKSFQCEHCQTKLWFPLETLTRPLLCYCCNLRISIPVAPDPASQDSYRLNELFIQAIDQGVLSTLLTANLIWRQSNVGTRIISAIEVIRIEDRSLAAEIDLIFTLGRRLGVCEVKTDQAFDMEQVNRLMRLAHEIGSDFLVFGTLKDKDSAEVKELYSHLQESNLPRPVLILTRSALLARETPRLPSYISVMERPDRIATL